jgi:phosphohistidine phosphatase
MDRLILFRHGKAEPDSESGEDFDRRLTARGIRESAEMGARLADMGFQPVVALVSPAARAKQTWESAQAAFPSAQTRFLDHLYHADPHTIRRAAEEAGETAGTVAMVGHNPGMQELTVRLLQEGGAPPDRIARAQAVFLIDANGRPHYDGLFFPDR